MNKNNQQTLIPSIVKETPDPINKIETTTFPATVDTPIDLETINMKTLSIEKALELQKSLGLNIQDFENKMV